jgi:hypothetical protein
MTPIKITNTGYVLMQDNKGNYYVWNNGSSGEALQPSSAGDVINATDIPVWGNFVNVSIQGDKIEAIHFLCNPDGQSTAQGALQPLDASASLTAALPDIKSALRIKSQYEVLKAELFYVNQSTLQGSVPNLANDFVPAWHFVINRSYKGNGSVRDLHEVWVDASTGKLLAHQRY